MLGTNHPDTMNSVDNLALVLQDRGSYSEAADFKSADPSGGDEAPRDVPPRLNISTSRSRGIL